MCVSHGAEMEIVDGDRVKQRFNVPYGAHLFVQDGDTVEAETLLFEWDLYNKPVVTERAGTVRFVDIKDKATVREEVDENARKRRSMPMPRAASAPSTAGRWASWCWSTT